MKLNYILSSTLFILIPSQSIAQVIPDSTLPINSQITPIPNGVIIDQGTQSGNNLFHSFEKFSLPRGEAAIFNNNQNIQNIITRVTGADPSLINGIIQSNGTANLLFINPNGIIFGPEAKLFIGGAFLGTTANNIIFPNGQVFGRNTPNFSLTINTPIGLNFSSSSKPIQVNNNGNNITKDFLFAPINRSQKPLGLQTTFGATLALIGNGIYLDGGILTVNGGNLFLGSVESGTVDMKLDNMQFNFEFSSIIQRNDISLSQESLLDGVFFGNNAINVYGNNITLSNSSIIASQNLGSLPDKTISIDAKTLTISGIADGSANVSGIVSESLDLGSASNISIKSEALSIKDGGAISTIAYGEGGTGFISIETQEFFNIRGFTVNQSSGVSSINFGLGLSQPIIIETPSLTITNLGTIGSITTFSPGADINLNTQLLSVEDGGLILATSLNSGKVGNIDIVAKNILISGFGMNFNESNLGIPIISTNIENLSGIFTSSTGTKSETSAISITTESLTLTDGAIVGSVSLGSADTSSITISAKDITVSGSSPSNAPSQIASRTLAGGDANVISIDTNTIRVSNGGTINTSTTSTGNAGIITINAFDNIILENKPGNFLPTTISASAEILDSDFAQLVGVPAIPPTGQGGRITLTSPKLSVSNSSITAKHEGIGLGGDLILNVGKLSLNQGNISTTTISGNGGNIAVNAESVFLNRSAIATSSANTGNGGNIDLNSNFFGLFNNSQIQANASKGDGGTISLNANAFFSDGTNQITAISTFGVDGIVNINTNPYNFDITTVSIPNQISPSELALKSCYDYGQRLAQTGQGHTPRERNRAGRTFEDLIPMGQVVSIEKFSDGRVRLLTCQEILKLQPPQN